MSRKILAGLAKTRSTAASSASAAAARRLSAERARADEAARLHKEAASAQVDRLLSKSTARIAAASSARKRGPRGRRRKSAPAPDSYVEPASTALPDLEFVAPVRRAKKITPRVTSDYSDMFGPEYLIVGAEVAAVKAAAKGSSEESAAIRREEAEKKKRRREYVEKLEKFERVERMMREKGELDSRKGKEKLRKLRERVHASEWVKVEEPVSAFESVAPSRRPPRLPAAGARKGGADARAGASVHVSSTAPPRARTLAAQNKQRKSALLARLGISKEEEAAPARHSRDVNGARGSGDRRAAARSRAREEEMRARARARKRARDVYSDEESEERDRRPARRRAPEKRRRLSREVSDSESEYESESDDVGGGGMFESSFADIEEEEARSAALGKLEDKRELQKEKKRKEAKEDFKRKKGLI